MRRIWLAIGAGCLVAGICGGSIFLVTAGAYFSIGDEIPVEMHPGATFDEVATTQYREHTSTWGIERRLGNLFRLARMGVFRVQRPSEFENDPEQFQQKVADFFSQQDGCRNDGALGKGGSFFVDCATGAHLQILSHDECCGSSIDEVISKSAPDSLTVLVFSSSLVAM